nr:MAG TPA: hypothetical protein [Caudoviricetes sp.]
MSWVRIMAGLGLLLPVMVVSCGVLPVFSGLPCL